MHRTLSFLFPGQGSQEPGMGRDIAEYWSEAMNLWKQAERISGLPLREIYWDTDPAAMAKTRHLQPALTVTNISLWAFAARHLQPGALAGHSLGEFSALYAAQCLELDDVLRLVSLRGQLMDEVRAEDGAMAAILKLSETQVQTLVDAAKSATGQDLRIANYNTPAQFVISGHCQAVNHVLGALRAVKGRGVLLPVSNAFHSPVMQEAGTELARVITKLPWRDPQTPLYVNVTGQAVHTAYEVQKSLAEQMTSSVLWTQTIMEQYKNGLRTFLEFGPKGALCRMVTPILAGHNDVTTHAIDSLEHTAVMETLQ